MAKKSERSRELELLGEKIREAKELIGQLKERNRALTAELAEARGRPTASGSEQSEAKNGPSRRQSKSAQSSQLELLRRERQEIREKISYLLEKLEAESGSGSAG